MSDPNSNASGLVRALVSAGRSDLPDAERMQAVWARVGPLAAAGAGGAASGGAGTGATSAGAAAAVATVTGGVGLKVIAGMLVGVAVAGGGVVALRRAPAPHAEARAAVAPAPVVVVPASPAGLASAPGPSVQAARGESAVDFAVPVTSLPVAVPLPVRPSPAAASAAPVASPSVAAAAPAEAPIESEISLLQAAKAALHDDPATALALSDRHAARFAGGALAQEREVIAIEALLALGRGDEARDRGARFVRDFPHSAHRLRIESLLGRTDHNP
jgi:hypothetical protein